MAEESSSRALVQECSFLLTASKILQQVWEDENTNDLGLNNASLNLGFRPKQRWEGTVAKVSNSKKLCNPSSCEGISPPMASTSFLPLGKTPSTMSPHRPYH